MRFVKGADFPTGGVVMGKSGIRKAYETGRGTIIVRAKVDIEEQKMVSNGSLFTKFHTWLIRQS